jgi:hypothetical protein
VSEGHAILAPSSAEQWGPGGCPASVNMQAMFPEPEDSPDTLEGTAAHYVASEGLLGRTVAEGDTAPNGQLIDREMVEDVEGVIQHWPSWTLYVEERVDMHVNAHPDCDGTPDAVVVDDENHRVFVWDFKYGHRYHDVFRHWQLVLYAIGVMERDRTRRADWPRWSFTLTIVQPRNYHPDGPVREWTFGGGELIGYATDLQAAAIAARSPVPEFKTGTYCRDCTAAGNCGPLQREALRYVDMAQKGQPVQLGEHALSYELRLIKTAVKRLEARKNGLEAEALAMVRRGVNLPHWKGEYAYGREKFTDENTPEVIAALGDVFGVDLRKPLAVLTPTQARKAGIPADVIKPFSHVPRGALTLVEFDETDFAKRFSLEKMSRG